MNNHYRRRLLGVAAAIVTTVTASFAVATPAHAAPEPPHTGQKLCEAGIGGAEDTHLYVRTTMAGMTLRLHNTYFLPVTKKVTVNGEGLLVPMWPYTDWVNDYGDIHSTGWAEWRISLESFSGGKSFVGYEVWAYKCDNEGDFNSAVVGYGKTYDDRDGAIADAHKEKAVHENAMKASCREIPGLAEEGNADGPGKPRYYSMKLDCVYWAKIG